MFAVIPLVNLQICEFKTMAQLKICHNFDFSSPFTYAMQSKYLIYLLDSQNYLLFI